MKKSILFALAGFGLGLGAPTGAFLYLWLFQNSSIPFHDCLVAQWVQNSFFYKYMLMGTCAVFALFGYVLGRYADIILIRDRRHSQEAQTDPLTGLGNHRFLHETFRTQYQNRKSDSDPISCLMVDLDFFKKVNDNYGHPFGDEVLEIFANLIEKVIRPGDIPTRYGGEEFMCVLPHCGKEEARQVAERVRQEMESYVFYFKKSQIRITVSIGVATDEGLKKDYKDLIRLADRALYRAKEQGRNRVAVV
ncbi:MAG TPA: GGDEF domain-containing protein [bacterium]